MVTSMHQRLQRFVDSSILLHMHRILSLLCVLVFIHASVRGDNPQTQPATRESATQPSDDSPVVTEHETTIAGKTIRYSAAAGLVTLRDDAGDKPRAKMFYIAYTVPGETHRPVTFVFNGGPGAAAIWLHLGTAGPQRIKLNDDGTPLPPPYSLEKNESSWLDLTDLVFIDPVGTGYSRPEADKGKEFYSVQGDVQSVADFIRIYLTRNNRWNAAKFIAGESYGTTRAAGLSEYLHDRFGIDLSGVILVSTVLNFQTLSFDAGNDTVYPLWLPTYAATAWYHKKIATDKQITLANFVAQARKWAQTDYATALIRGNSLSDDERAKIEGELAGFTGLPIDFVRKSDLRIAPYRFQKELLSDQRKVIGRMDGRLTAHDADPLSGGPEFDPSVDGYTGVFSGTFNQYIRQELKYENEQVYEFLSPRVGPWDWGRNNGYVNVAANLRKCMTKLPSLKVFVAQGYYDFATPFAASDYTLDQMPLSKDLQSNITRAYYEGGHMMYLNKASLEKLKKDLSGFYSTRW
jgi:carboxypeptidase C (cathepsin A)